GCHGGREALEAVGLSSRSLSLDHTIRAGDDELAGGYLPLNHFVVGFGHRAEGKTPPRQRQLDDLTVEASQQQRRLTGEGVAQRPSAVADAEPAESDEASPLDLSQPAVDQAQQDLRVVMDHRE